MAKCKIENRWMYSIESAGIGITSPKGGHLFIRKLDMDLVTEEQWAIVKKCAFHSEKEIELSVEEMTMLLAAVKASKGLFYKGNAKFRRTERRAEQREKELTEFREWREQRIGEVNKVTSTGSLATAKVLPQKSVPQQKSYMQRNVERLKRISNSNSSTLQGTCPNCSRPGLKVKHHDTWAGYYCSKCSTGGSITLKK